MHDKPAIRIRFIFKTLLKRKQHQKHIIKRTFHRGNVGALNLFELNRDNSLFAREYFEVSTIIYADETYASVATRLSRSAPMRNESSRKFALLSIDCRLDFWRGSGGAGSGQHARLATRAVR
jgi:hypothetical protein